MISSMEPEVRYWMSRPEQAVARRKQCPVVYIPIGALEGHELIDNQTGDCYHAVMRVRIIGISGGSGSGKTTIVRRIAEIIPDFICLAQDSYYKSAEFVDNKNITAFNFDHPSAFDTDLMVEHLRALKRGETIHVPVYDFVHHRRSGETVEVAPRSLVLFEGIMVFVDPRVRELMDLKLYVDTPDDIRFIRRLERDITERGRTVESVITQYIEKVRPGHFEFIEPTKAYADLIIPEGGNNEKALQVLTSFMQAIR